jgi:hypothetical protein
MFHRHRVHDVVCLKTILTLTGLMASVRFSMWIFHMTSAYLSLKWREAILVCLTGKYRDNAQFTVWRVTQKNGAISSLILSTCVHVH